MMKIRDIRNGKRIEKEVKFAVWFFRTAMFPRKKFSIIGRKNILMRIMLE